MKIGLFCVFENNMLRRRSDLPIWHVADNLALLKKVTAKRVLILDKTNWLALTKFRSQLPKRVIVITSDKLSSDHENGIYFVKDLRAALLTVRVFNLNKIWILGSQDFVKQAEPIASEAISLQHGSKHQTDMRQITCNVRKWNIRDTQVVHKDKDERTCYFIHSMVPSLA